MIGAEFVQLTLVPLVIAVMASLVCALPGNFLLLRQQALIGDAISHVVLPGIVGAFIVTGVISAWPMMIGAAAAALIAVAAIEAIRRLGRIEAGAAMGVVFTAMFALGVLVLERSDTRGVHLDVEHALFGNLESLIWFDADGWGALLDLAALGALPEQVSRLAIVLAVMAVFLRLAWRSLAISTFDQDFAKSIGIPTQALGIALVGITAVAAVAAFDAVGSIIVIAMFVCPPATARLLTNSLPVQVGLSAICAVIAAISGTLVAGYLPLWLGAENALSAAGMIAVMSGLGLLLACLFGLHRRGSAQTRI